MPQFIRVPYANSLQHLNADDLTAIIQTDRGTHFFDSRGLIFSHETEDAKLDIRKIAHQLNGFVPFEFRDSDGATRQKCYVQRSAITFMTISAGTNDNYGLHHSIIIGIKGVGSLESYNSTEDEVSCLVAHVEDWKFLTGREQDLLCFRPEEAHARWHKPGLLYIDTSEVTAIRQDIGGQLWVSFRNAGQLNIQPGEQDQQKIYKEITTADPSLKQDFDNVVYRMDQERKRRQNIALAALAQKLAAGNPELMHIPNPTSALYIQSTDLRRVIPQEANEHHGPAIYIEYWTIPRGQYPETQHLSYDSVAERDAVLNNLLGKADPKPAKAFKP